MLKAQNRTLRFSTPTPSLLLGLALAACGAAPDDVATATGDSIESSGAQATAGRTNYTVDRGTDGTDGVCRANRPSGGTCNLRAAVAAALGTNRPVTITLAVDSQITGGEIAVTPPTAGRANITIEGSGKKVTGSSNSRLFNVAANVELTLSSFTISAFSAFEGGAIFNAGTLALSGVTVAGNTVSCFGLGAQTAFAFCDGGAISNQGRLTIGGGSKIDGNRVSASAFTASFTNATAGGGAINNTGTLVLSGAVSFSGNVADATATSGVHPGPTGASASSSGGAINNTGTLRVIGGAIGHCTFSDNVASATASAPTTNTGSATSTGGAIASFGGTVVLPPNACTFRNNQAAVDPDVHIE